MSIRFSKKSSVLVFGAHPDDAVRSNAGVILRAMQVGAKVAIVKATDGAALGGPEFIPQGRRRGETRKREELSALRVLGFERKDLCLLGFPDGGLEAVRFDYFNRTGLPYLDPWLASDRTFGRDTFKKGVRFFGADLLALIARVVAKTRPTHVFTHCSRDRHPDHRAITWFVKEALAARGLEPEIYEYLTYHTRCQKPKWPPNPGERISRAAAAKLKLPGRLVDFPLSPAEACVKDVAIDQFLPVLGAAYFKPWRRTNEVFWRTG